MNEFDNKANGWDLNPMHLERAESIARHVVGKIPLQPWMIALEFGAGTGLTSFLIKDHLKEITMMDSSSEMVRIMTEKIEAAQANNLKAICFDLEKHDWHNGKFDLILSQMVLHHVDDIDSIIKKFYMMLNPGGYIAVADLLSEDGSFHGPGFTGHNGFDMQELSALISKHGFIDINSDQCFVINKKTSDTEIKQFDVFLLIANRRLI
ncbi:MAG: class I SAM-dependent methyltransferase [Bacteroidales bacterium]|jgi:2-polyprenyl-3-methyl-5-hydroxy-6-metoxy-1,4-benzoquinol methylase|nr:class I SAM-dependent methyltransferase [Bacteroidales bacterium]